jgi:uncharacterized membrane protein YeaQ/YmgE (transglycosylase-associated protein family)
MSLIMMILVGGIVGWLAGLIMKTHRQMGVLADIVVGIVGSALGTWVFSLLTLAPYGPLGALIVDVVGAVLLIGILKGLKVYC